MPGRPMPGGGGPPPIHEGPGGAPWDAALRAPPRRLRIHMPVWHVMLTSTVQWIVLSMHTYYNIANPFKTLASHLRCCWVPKPGGIMGPPAGGAATAAAAAAGGSAAGRSPGPCLRGSSSFSLIDSSISPDLPC